jgi:hypothetical protein
MMDLRWQMVLDCLGASEPPFSQGALQAFRERMVGHEMDRALLERTVALVRDGALSKAEGQALTKAVRVAIDSRPLPLPSETNRVGRQSQHSDLARHRYEWVPPPLAHELPRGPRGRSPERDR